MLRRLPRLLAGLVVILAGAYLLLSLIVRPVADAPFFAGTDMLVIAHQGGEGLRPSNTMASFSHAVELGVDVLEMDVHSTADGVLVVIHDDTVDRTTDGTGRIQDLTLEEIKALDAGHYWTDDRGETFPYRGQGITVPTLAELFIAFPEMRMNIEIKQETPSIVVPFCRLVQDYDRVDKILVGSFHQATIEEVRDRCPGVATGMVESEIRRLYILNAAYLGALFPAPSQAIQAPEFSGDIHVVTESFVKAAQGHNVKVHVWTVNEVDDMQRLLDIDVDGIITDRPDRLLELLAQR